jgi:hypothetical protein
MVLVYIRQWVGACTLLNLGSINKITHSLELRLMTTTTQQALADRVGPLGEDANKQGGLGEFFSRDGRDTYFGGANGQEFGGVRSDIANSDSEVIGANSAYYASGECHSDREKEACQ